MSDLNLSKSRKAITKKLTTGQTIHLNPQDDKALKNIYDYMNGFAKRKAIENLIDVEKNNIQELNSQIPQSVKLMMNQQYRSTPVVIDGANISNQSSISDEANSDSDYKIDHYLSAKENLKRLEEKLKAHSSIDHKISFKDLEVVFKSLGVNASKKYIEHLIWEVDEKSDEMICYEEFLLTYYRNLSDTTGNEPCSFFRLQEFMIFDAQHKGYIIEDDCMEILYGRYGGGNLEKELKFLFGNKLRALGGDGTLNLQGYFNSVEGRTGRRALVF